MNDECSNNLKVAVIGAGAIGGIVATFLKQAGYNVRVVSKHMDYAELIEKRGFIVSGKRKASNVRLKAVPNILDLRENIDIFLLTVKSTDLNDVLKELVQLSNQEYVVVTMENGIVEKEVVKVVGTDRTIGCVTGFGATMHEKGNLEMTSLGEFVIGTLDNAENEKIHLVKKMLESVVPTYISKNIIGDLYSKLIINCCITSLGAICGLYLGDMLKIKKVRNIFLEIVIEAVKVANAAGIKIEPYGRNKLNFYKLVATQGKFGTLVKHMLIRIIGMKFKKIKSSSLQSLERGKKTEIFYLNGFICDTGRQHGIKTPINDAIVKIIEEIEDGKRKITIENFNEPIFSRF